MSQRERSFVATVELRPGEWVKKRLTRRTWPQFLHGLCKADRARVPRGRYSAKLLSKLRFGDDPQERWPAPETVLDKAERGEIVEVDCEDMARIMAVLTSTEGRVNGSTGAVTDHTWYEVPVPGVGFIPLDLSAVLQAVRWGVDKVKRKSVPKTLRRIDNLDRAIRAGVLPDAASVATALAHLRKAVSALTPG